MLDDLDSTTRPGQVLAGKYRIDRVLGAGGMGVVVAATHLQLEQRVAIKLVRREALANPEVVARFEREARLAVRLRSEHVARVIDVGRLPDGAPYIVMEYLEGQDLAAVLAQRGALPVTLASDYVIQACEAIAEAHALGIVHRDLKPANLFLAATAHGQHTVKVLDFGISKSAIGAELDVTKTQAVMGSPGYMSPEQMRSTKHVDGRSDVWALGVILYELVAGHPPFAAETFTALCVKIAVDPHPPLLRAAAALPAGFAELVDRALQKDPALRTPSVVELARALALHASPFGRELAQRLAHGAGAAAGAQQPTPVAAGPAVPTTLAGAAGSAPVLPRGRIAALALGAAGVAFASVLGVLLLWPQSPGAQDPQSASRAPAVVDAGAPPVDAGLPRDGAAAATPDSAAPARAAAAAQESASAEPASVAAPGSALLDAGTGGPSAAAAPDPSPDARTRGGKRQRGRGPHADPPTRAVDPYSSPD